MAASLKFFSIPAIHSSDAEEELNRFMGSVKVVHIRKEFVSNGDDSFWAVLVSYLSGAAETAEQSSKKPRVDYRAKLDPDTFALYAKLRDWRKTVAEKEGISLFLVFTNEQLAQIAQKRITGKEKLLSVEGIGESKTEKYGEAVFAIVKAETGTSEEKISEKEIPEK